MGHPSSRFELRAILCASLEPAVAQRGASRELGVAQLGAVALRRPAIWPLKVGALPHRQARPDPPLLAGGVIRLMQEGHSGGEQPLLEPPARSGELHLVAVALVQEEVDQQLARPAVSACSAAAWSCWRARRVEQRGQDPVLGALRVQLEDHLHGGTHRTQEIESDTQECPPSRTPHGEGVPAGEGVVR